MGSAKKTRTLSALSLTNCATGSMFQENFHSGSIRNAGRSLGEHFKALAEAGYFVGARKRFLLLTGGVSSEPSSWRSVDIEIQPVASALLADEDGSPLQSDGTASPGSSGTGD